jgi:hypothetical protein
MLNLKLNKKSELYSLKGLTEYQIKVLIFLLCQVRLGEKRGLGKAATDLLLGYEKSNVLLNIDELICDLKFKVRKKEEKKKKCVSEPIIEFKSKTLNKVKTKNKVKFTKNKNIYNIKKLNENQLIVIELLFANIKIKKDTKLTDEYYQLIDFFSNQIGLEFIGKKDEKLLVMEGKELSKNYNQYVKFSSIKINQK